LWLEGGEEHEHCNVGWGLGTYIQTFVDIGSLEKVLIVEFPWSFVCNIFVIGFL
jgi:hypothetical protein